MASIVVGVDGSANSIAALRWAANEAKLRGCTLRAVHVWEYPYAALAPSPVGAAVPPVVDMQETAVAILDSALDDAALPPDVVVEKLVCEGSAAKVLLDESKRDAELLVVGSRGHGGFVGLLLGSIATQVVHHVDIPTVVVRAPEQS